MKINLYNAAKYFSKIVPPIIAIIFSKQNPKKVGNNVGFILFFISNVIATVYCTIWDYYMDWGLFRSKKIFMLRD